MKLRFAHIHWFRFQRSGLVEPFATLEETAGQMLGVQAQLLAAADLAFWHRTANCSLADVRTARLEQRSLVRFWGQRNTLHIYRSSDWPFLHAAFGEVQALIRRRLEKAGLTSEFHRLVQRTARRMAQGQTLTYADIRSKKLAELVERPQVIAYLTFMQLVRRGVVCHGQEQGGGSQFVHREQWLPDLDWSPPPSETAQGDLAVRYLRTYGPAEMRDLAFWYGTSMATAGRWLAATGDRCVTMEVDGRTFWYAAEDQETLAVQPPARSRWPIRMLYRFDPMLLATKDKTWLIEDAHYKRVWRPAAHVEPSLIVAGRIAGTWRYDRTSRGLSIRLTPFKSLTRGVVQAVEKQAASIADFVELPLVQLDIES